MDITINSAQVIHDIRQTVYRMSAARHADDEVKFKAQLGDTASDEQLLYRFVAQGAARVKRILRYVLNKSHEDAESDLEKRESYEFYFTQDYADSEALAQIIHWYIVRWGVWQWMQEFSPSDAGMGRSELDVTESELKHIEFKDKPELNMEEWT